MTTETERTPTLIEDLEEARTLAASYGTTLSRELAWRLAAHRERLREEMEENHVGHGDCHGLVTARRINGGGPLTKGGADGE